jgi:hypothetical protein
MSYGLKKLMEFIFFHRLVDLFQMVLMIDKQILFSKIKSHLQNTLLYFTDSTGGNLVERGLYQ